MKKSRLAVIGCLVLAGLLAGGCGMLFHRDPEAAFSWKQVEGTLTIQFDASASSAHNSEIVSYSWEFGDGTTETTSTSKVGHTFPDSDRSYQVKLSVADDKGAIGCITKSVAVNHVPPEIRSLEAVNLDYGCTLIFTCNRIQVTVDAFSPVGSPLDIVIYSGDGRKFEGPKAIFHYDKIGKYTIRAVATDAKGATTEATKSIVVSAWRPLPPEVRVWWSPSVNLGSVKLSRTIRFTIDAHSPNYHATWCLDCLSCLPPDHEKGLCELKSKGIQQIYVLIEGPCGYSKIHEVECQHRLVFDIKFDRIGEWKIRGMVTDDGRPNPQSVTFQYSIDVVE